MEIQFKTKQLRKQYEDIAEANKAYPSNVARKYIQRINIIKSAHTIQDIKKINVLRCHPLKGKRKRQWAINLTGFYRLIFTLKGDQLEIVRIEEVSKHYDD